MIKFPIRVSPNGKHIFIEWDIPVDVTSNITIKAKKTKSSNQIKMDSIVVAYREKVL